MKVTVITACYNAARTLSDAMDSVVRQRLGDGDEVEYIVIDGGSADGTAELLRAFAARVAGAKAFSFRWASERDEGMYDAINKGVRMATGEVIGILNADDRYEDGHVLRDVLAGFAGGADAIYGDVRFVRGDDPRTVRYYSSRPWRPWMHNFGYMPAHPSVYVRREVFGRCGGYRLGYDISADFEWMVRLFCRARVRATYLPRCFVTMRLGGKSTAGLRALWRLNCENVRANRENGFFCCLPMMVPKYCYKILGYVKRRGGGR